MYSISLGMDICVYIRGRWWVEADWLRNRRAIRAIRVVFRGVSGGACGEFGREVFARDGFAAVALWVCGLAGFLVGGGRAGGKWLQCVVGAAIFGGRAAGSRGSRVGGAGSCGDAGTNCLSTGSEGFSSVVAIVVDRVGMAPPFPMRVICVFVSRQIWQANEVRQGQAWCVDGDLRVVLHY